jgi:hypothetical protein
MKKENLLIILLTLIIILLIVLFVIYGSKLLSIFKEDLSNKAEKNNRGDIAMVMVELKDAEKELVVLQELAQDQEQAAKIEILLEKVNFYETEFQKADQKNAKQTLEDFYNSGLWEGIADLKNKLEKSNSETNVVPELE